MTLLDRLYTFPAHKYRSTKSLIFDGVDEYMAHILFFGDTFALSSSNAFTISIWVKHEDSGAGPQTILSRWAPHPSGWFNSGGWFLNVQTASAVTRALTFYFGQYVFNMNWMYSNVDFPYDEWIHVAITFDGSGTKAGLKMYWNAVAQATTIIGKTPFWSGVTPTNNYSHLIWGSMYDESSWPPFLNEFWEGKQDETSFWRYELSATEVLEMYHQGRPQHPMHIGYPAGKTCDTHFRMGEKRDGEILSGLGVCYGRWPVTGTARIGLWNRPTPSRISEDTPP